MLSIIFKSECSGTAKKSKKYINMYYSTFINFRKAWPTAPDDNTTRRFKTYNLTYKAALPHRQYRLNTKKTSNLVVALWGYSCVGFWIQSS